MPELSVPPELEDVANQVGGFIEYWGFKNVHGRIWTHLYLSPHPLDAGHLMERLSISKALTSISLSELLQYDVIQVSGKGERGTVLYKANSDVMSVITNVLRARERRMLCRLSGAARTLRDLPDGGKNSVPLEKERVQLLIEMIKQAESCLDGLLQMTEVDFSCLAPIAESKN
jgi:DNA-binding transcriptional regulator GbsR (MarR family)